MEVHASVRLSHLRGLVCRLLVAVVCSLLALILGACVAFFSATGWKCGCEALIEFSWMLAWINGWMDG